MTANNPGITNNPGKLSTLYTRVKENPGKACALAGGALATGAVIVVVGPTAIAGGAASGALWLLGNIANGIANAFFAVAGTTAVAGGGVYAGLKYFDVNKKIEDGKKKIEWGKQAVIDQPHREFLRAAPVMHQILSSQTPLTKDNFIKLCKDLTPLYNVLSDEQKEFCAPTVQMIQAGANGADLDLNEAFQRLQELAQFLDSCRAEKEGYIYQFFHYLNPPPSFSPLAPQIKSPANNDNGFVPQIVGVVKENVREVVEVVKENVSEIKQKAVDATKEKYTDTKSLLWQLPGKAYNWATGTTPINGPRVIDVTNQPDAAAEGTLSRYFTYACSLLEGLVGAENGATAHYVAGTISIGLNMALDKMRESEVSEEKQEIVQRAITALEVEGRNGNWAGVINHFTEAAKTVRSVPITVDGIQLPFFGDAGAQDEISEAALTKNLDLLEDVTAEPPLPEPENQNWEELAKGESKLLAHNCAKYLAIKYIYEEVCGLKPENGDMFYLQMLEDSREDGPESQGNLRKLLFKKLDEKNVGWGIQLWASLVYWIRGSLAKQFLEAAITIYFAEIFKYIDDHTKEDFSSLKKLMMTNFTNYLTILGGAYEAIAKKTPATGGLDEMLRGELDKRTSNYGFNSMEIYEEMAKTIIDKVFDKSLIGSIGAWILSWFINPGEIIKSIVESSSTMQDVRGYTHAINTVISDQLDEIWKLLKAPPSNSNDNLPAGPAPVISPGDREQLSALVQNLYEVLGKTKCRSQGELLELLKGDGYIAKLKKTFDDKLIDSVMDTTTTFLASSLNSVAVKDQLQKLTYNFSRLMNEAYKPTNEVTPQHMDDIEHHIEMRSEQILRFAIETAIKSAFDPKIQQTETKRFITELHERANKYFHGIRKTETEAGCTGALEDLEELAQMKDLTSLEAKNKIEKIVAEAHAFEKNCEKAVNEAEKANISSGNQKEISKRYANLGRASAQFVTAITQLKTNIKALEDFKTANPPMKKTHDSLSKIETRLRRKAPLSPEEFIFVRKQLTIFEESIRVLTSVRNGLRQGEKDNLKGINEIFKEIDNIATTLVKMESSNATEELRDEYTKSLDKIRQTILQIPMFQFDFAENAEKGAYDARDLAKQYLGEFEKWEKAEIKEASHMNLSSGFAKTLQKPLESKVYGLVEGHLKNLLGFVKRDETYRYGLFHHLLLLPHLKSIGVTGKTFSTANYIRPVAQPVLGTIAWLWKKVFG